MIRRMPTNFFVVNKSLKPVFAEPLAAESKHSRLAILLKVAKLTGRRVLKLIRTEIISLHEIRLHDNHW